MTIEEYLGLTRSYTPGLEPMAHILPLICATIFREKVTLTVVRSDVARNETVKIGDDFYIVWDERYWDYFTSHLAYTLALDTTDDGFQLACQTDAIFGDCLRLAISRMRYDHPQTALILAKFYSNYGRRALEPDFPAENIRDMLNTAKIYAYLHEYFHMRYSRHPEKYDIALGEITQILLDYQGPIRDFIGSFISEDRMGNITMQDVDTLFQRIAARACDAELDELVVDSAAFAVLVAYTKMSNRLDNESMADILPQMVNSVRVLRSFNKMLRGFEDQLKLFCMGDDEKEILAFRAGIEKKLLFREALSIFPEMIQAHANLPGVPMEKILDAYQKDTQRPYKRTYDDYTFHLQHKYLQKMARYLNSEVNILGAAQLDQPQQVLDFLLAYEPQPGDQEHRQRVRDAQAENAQRMHEFFAMMDAEEE